MWNLSWYSLKVCSIMHVQTSAFGHDICENLYNYTE